MTRHIKKGIRIKIKTLAFILVLVAIFISLNSSITYAKENKDKYEISLAVPSNGNDSTPSVVQMLLTLTVITLAPSILMMFTSFVRIIVVLHFTRSAIGTQTTPPNQVLIALALFLTYFIMSPVFMQINEKAIKPYNEGKMNTEKAVEKAMDPLREFMFKQTRSKDIKMFADIVKVNADDKAIEEKKDIPNTVLVPAYTISELRSAFIIGFLIYIPFIIVDMVVASTLMSMGMMMLPPTVISLPFKILLFILADGWNLIIGNLVKTFY